MFVEREAEKQFLSQYFAREGSQVLVVYGQRGVGKTTLLKHFAEGKKYSYYAARACSDREQRYQWASELLGEGVRLERYPEYGELFAAVLPELIGMKQLLIIDEFHNMVKGGDSFMEELLAFLGKRPSNQQVMVLLATSASGWVENNMIRKMGSAALSLNGLLKMRVMKFEEIRQIYKGYSRSEALQIYTVLGGLPGLWNHFSEKLGIGDNIIQHILSGESRLSDAVSLILSEELREPAVYNTILAAMARGCNKLNDIYRHTGFSRAKISVYLKNLMELGLVEKVFSFETAGYENAQKGIYRISNHYVRFYFRFLYPNLSLMANTSPREFYERVIAEGFPEFMEESYRKICRETLLDSAVSVGEWIGKEGNLDIIARDGKGNLIVAGCSCARKVTCEDYEWLLFCAKKARVKPGKVILFGEKGFDGRLLEEEAAGRIELRHII